MAAGSGKMLFPRRKFSNKNYSSVLVKVKLLSGKVDDDSRGSFGLEGGEAGEKE
jgi:hypothetical protein